MDPLGYYIDPWHIMGIAKSMGFRTLYFDHVFLQKMCPHSRENTYMVHLTTSPYGMYDCFLFL